MLRHGKEGPEPKNIPAQNSRDGASENDRDQAARLPFKKQKFDGQKNRRDRRGKGRRHSTRGTRDEESFALSACQVKELRDHGSKRAARHDDRAFGAKRAA